MIAPHGPLPPASMTPTELRGLHPRLQVDRLRTFLRGGHADAQAAARDLDGWIGIFQASNEPPLLVLILELLAAVDDSRVVELARHATTHRGDGVRLEALRILFDRLPDQTLALAARHRDDSSLELRLMVADRLLAHDRAQAVDLAFEILQAEAGGIREHHALERATELLVEAGGADVAQRLREVQGDMNDPEGFIAWAIESIEQQRS
jgi:hypothetical protein